MANPKIRQAAPTIEVNRRFDMKPPLACRSGSCKRCVGITLEFGKRLHSSVESRSRCLLVGWGSYSQHRLSLCVLQRPVSAMCTRVDRNCMGVRSQESFRDFSESAVFFSENCNVATFSRDIQPMESGIKRKHVRISPD